MKCFSLRGNCWTTQLQRLQFILKDKMCNRQGRHNVRSMRLACHNVSAHQKMSEQRVGVIITTPSPRGLSSSSEAPSPKDSKTFLNSATSWGPSVQTQELKSTLCVQEICAQESDCKIIQQFYFLFCDGHLNCLPQSLIDLYCL